MGLLSRLGIRVKDHVVRDMLTTDNAMAAIETAIKNCERNGNPLVGLVAKYLRNNQRWAAELMNEFLLAYALGDDGQEQNLSPFGSTDMDYKSLAVSSIADYQVANGLSAAEGFDANDAASKLSDFIGKLRLLGVNWQTIFNLVALVLPMITSGKIDWAAIWAAIQVLIPTPNPNPGPMSP